MPDLRKRQFEADQQLFNPFGEGQKPLRLTIKAYRRLAEAGFLEEGKRYELLHGVIMEMQPIGAWHSYKVKRLNDMLNACAGSAATVFSQSPVQIHDDNESEPDILVLKPPLKQYENRIPNAGDVLLIIEVSDSTLRTDRIVKLELYAGANIPEYWMLNLERNQLEIQRRPDLEQRRYLETPILTDETPAAALHLPECQIEWWS